MIQKIGIENYKSIEKLDFEIGRFNVFIGENGCGKSNILEAVAFAACSDNLDNGLLSLKGVRVSEPRLFRSGFDKTKTANDITFILTTDDSYIKFSFNNENEPYSKWTSRLYVNNNIIDNITNHKTWTSRSKDKEAVLVVIEHMKDAVKETSLENYILFSPENHFLRTYNIETPYSQPLGTKGEGLLKLIKVIKKEKPEEYKEILESLQLIDWFENIEVNEDDLSGTEFKISDKYLVDGIGSLDIKNANEGFFLLLFYITLFVSDYTPSFFAIDNIDTALNPKLCTKLIEILADLAKKHNKQVLITTHNPSILDGINLNDDEQRLFAVARNKMGYTRVNRIEKKAPVEGEKSLKLSEQFMRGYIGGIPKNF